MSIALHEALARVAPISGVSIVVRDFNPIVNAQPTGENAALVSRMAQLEALIATLRNR